MVCRIRKGVYLSSRRCQRKEVGSLQGCRKEAVEIKTRQEGRARAGNSFLRASEEKRYLEVNERRRRSRERIVSGRWMRGREENRKKEKRERGIDRHI